MDALNTIKITRPLNETI
uniref:Uncharacterized protein n=1 Tax=Rhizophora mucronata TaxID=61149 RepID=A0A2P2R5A8_RHIMU